MKNDRLANELNQLTKLYKDLVTIAESLRTQGDRNSSAAVQGVAFGLQDCQLNILTSLVNDPARSKVSKVSGNAGVF